MTANPKFIATKSGQILIFSNSETHSDTAWRFQAEATHAGFVDFPDAKAEQPIFWGKSVSLRLSSEGVSVPPVEKWYGVKIGEEYPWYAVSNDKSLLESDGLVAHEAPWVGIKDDLGNEVWLPQVQNVSLFKLARFANRMATAAPNEMQLVTEATLVA